jgi:DNA-binding transcriptional ArsR family regulator
MVCGMAVIADQIFKALADPTRRAIFEGLARDGEQTVHALTRRAAISQPAVSKHLVILKRAKLVGHRREGRETHYSANPKALAPLADWMSLYSAFWSNRLDALESLLDRMDK